MHGDPGLLAGLPSAACSLSSPPLPPNRGCSPPLPAPSPVRSPSPRRSGQHTLERASLKRSCLIPPCNAEEAKPGARPAPPASPPAAPLFPGPASPQRPLPPLRCCPAGARPQPRAWLRFPAPPPAHTRASSPRHGPGPRRPGLAAARGARRCRPGGGRAVLRTCLRAQPVAKAKPPSLCARHAAPSRAEPSSHRPASASAAQRLREAG